MTDTISNRRKPTTRELVAAKQVKTPAAPSPSAKRSPAVEPQTTAVAVPDTRPYRERYLDEVAPASIVGRMVKFSKEGTFITHDDGKEVPAAAEFTCLAEDTLVGWVKFNGDGESPDRIMGLLYDGFVMPSEKSLPDQDKSKWEIGLDGEPANPWQHHQYLVLQETRTLELFTFVASTKTGRRAVGNLLRHYNRTKKTNPNELPVIRLRTGGFQHRDARVGFVITPVFVPCGRQLRDSVAKPDTSIGGYLNDEIPFEGGGEDA